ncbi:hypothetical protein ACKKBG_A25075 [Auxenochlorella protothecoides x Auxenochlorella symbiontica]
MVIARGRVCDYKVGTAVSAHRRSSQVPTRRDRPGEGTSPPLASSPGLRRNQESSSPKDDVAHSQDSRGCVDHEAQEQLPASACNASEPDSQVTMHLPVAGEPAPPRARKKRRTAEEKARDEALKRALQDQKKLAASFSSQRQMLQHMTVLLDPRLMETDLGLAIGAKLQETQTGPPDKAVAFVVRDVGLAQYRAVRWTRRMLEDPGQEGAQARVREVEVPHVLICFKAAEFVEAVQADGLAGLLCTLSTHCPAARPLLLVCGLAAHLARLERAQHAQHMGTGGAAPGAVSRAAVEDLVTGLAVSHPGLGFREAVDGHAAAEHVLLLTTAIARSAFAKSESVQWFQAHSKRCGTAMEALLAQHPVTGAEQQNIEALCKLPSVLPSIAHAVVGRFGNLGRLMDELARAHGSATLPAFRTGIERMMRTGTSRPTKVGPKAAASLTDWLSCTAPERRVCGEAAE